MTERIPCTDCGAHILLSTAQRTGGLCMPCKGGFRKDIDASRQRAIEDKAYRQSAPAKLWSSLVERVHKTPTGFDELTRVEQIYFAIELLNGEVHNGGFDQYFFNSSADYYTQAVDGLMEIGATQPLRYLLDAKEVIFGATPLPPTSVRRQIMLALTPQKSTEVELTKQLEMMDKNFYAQAEDLARRIEGFAQTHELLPR